MFAALNERSLSVRGHPFPRTKKTGDVYIDDLVVLGALQCLTCMSNYHPFQWTRSSVEGAICCRWPTKKRRRGAKGERRLREMNNELRTRGTLLFRLRRNSTNYAMESWYLWKTISSPRFKMKGPESSCVFYLVNECLVCLVLVFQCHKGCHVLEAMSRAFSQHFQHERSSQRLQTMRTLPSRMLWL